MALVRWVGPVTTRRTQSSPWRGGRFLVLDTTRTSYADSGGLRWLFVLRHELEASGQQLRLAARPESRIRRTLNVIQVGIDLFDSVSQAWQTPWTVSEAKRTEAHNFGRGTQR